MNEEKIQKLLDMATAANNNCEQVVNYLSLYRPELAEEFRVFIKNIDKGLAEIEGWENE